VGLAGGSRVVPILSKAPGKWSDHMVMAKGCFGLPSRKGTDEALSAQRCERVSMQKYLFTGVLPACKAEITGAVLWSRLPNRIVNLALNKQLRPLKDPNPHSC